MINLILEAISATTALTAFFGTLATVGTSAGITALVEILTSALSDFSQTQSFNRNKVKQLNKVISDEIRDANKNKVWNDTPEKLSGNNTPQDIYLDSLKSIVNKRIENWKFIYDKYKNTFGFKDLIKNNGSFIEIKSNGSQATRILKGITETRFYRDILKMLKDLSIIDFENLKQVLISRSGLGVEYDSWQWVLSILQFSPISLADIYKPAKTLITDLPKIITDAEIQKEKEELIAGVSTGEGTTFPLPLLGGNDTITGKKLRDILTGLAGMTMAKVKAKAREKTERSKSKAKKAKRRKRRKRKGKKKKNKTPEVIRTISIDTNGVSKWIAKVVFQFPTSQNIESDGLGTLTFHIKGGGTIRKVRVRRGTFSVISQVYGTGYRVWSQFWKHRIVNKTVLSWFIQKINAKDRSIGIQQEIKDIKIKYR